MTTDGTIVLLGGRSEIGLAVVERLVAEHPRRILLAARRSNDLEGEAAQLRTAGALEVTTHEFDADDLATHEPLITELFTDRQVGTVIFAFGILGDQARAEADAAHAVAIVHTDYVAQVSLLSLAARALKGSRADLVVFSSVAGARVRRANYVYGSAKAGLDGFATGLAAALHGSGVHLVLVRPGFVLGRMTKGMDPAPFASTVAQVADAVVRGLRQRKTIVWVPGYLRWVAAAMRALPQPLWRRLPR